MTKIKKKREYFYLETPLKWNNHKGGCKVSWHATKKDHACSWRHKIIEQGRIHGYPSRVRVGRGRN